jgi:hypothetical protein
MESWVQVVQAQPVQVVLVRPVQLVQQRQVSEWFGLLAQQGLFL